MDNLGVFLLLHSFLEIDWGGFHPIFIHFPIVLFSAALICDLFNRKGAFYVGHWLIIAGSIMALPAILTGLEAAENFNSEDHYLYLHKVLGITAGVFGGIYAVLRIGVLYEKWALPQICYLILDVILVSLIYFTSDYGGLLTRPSTPFSTREKSFQDSEDLSELSRSQLLSYLQNKVGVEDVVPIFVKARCVQCHSRQFNGGYPVNFSIGKSPKDIFLPRNDKGELQDVENSPFYQTVILHNEMPKTHHGQSLGLSTADRFILLQWLNNNAPLR